MHELERGDCAKCRSLFEALEWNLITNAVVDGTSPGRIYVDHVENPRTAFMCTVEGYYLVGDYNDDEFSKSLNHLIFQSLFAGDTLRQGETDVAISYHPAAWRSKMPIIFHGRTPLKAARRHYICDQLNLDHWRSMVPKGFQVRRLDERLLRTPDLTVPAHVRDWMKTNWGSISNFMKKGFGFCMVHDKSIVSWSLTDCVSCDACEIGIHTREGYRRQGLATLTATAAVDHALSTGLRQVGWHCDEYNLGSIGAAEAVGFRLERKYVQYYACSNAAHHLEETAQAHFRAKRYREAVTCYARFFSTPPEQLPKWLREVLPQELGTHYFRVALAEASIGETDDALMYLERAVDSGWHYLDFLNSCDEFKNMHGTPRWKRILGKIRKNLNVSGSS